MLCHNWVGVVITLLCVASSLLPTHWHWLVWVCCSIPSHRQAPCSGQGWAVAMLNPLHRAQPPSAGCSNETRCSDIHPVLPSYSSLLGKANLGEIGKGLKQLSKPVLERLGLCVNSRYQWMRATAFKNGLRMVFESLIYKNNTWYLNKIKSNTVHL